jgi:UDP-N-acetylglucosamine:LPS N-acetylglucosamine transferase
MKKVLFISSTGGHLTELLQLKPMFQKYDYHIITEKTKSNEFLASEYPGKVNYLVYKTKHSKLTYPFVLLWNCFLSLFYFIKIRPKVVITTGTHTAGPMCCIAKIFGSKVIYIETFANITTRTVTGNLIYKFADLFIVQWESMLEIYPNAVYGGWIF